MTKLSETARKNKVDYNIEYKKKTIKQFKMDLNYNTMSDVIDWLDKQDNKQGYVIDLIRKDMLAKSNSSK